MISEKQLANLIIKQTAEVSEQDDTSTSSSTDVGTSQKASDYPSYPETGKWESKLTRGPANQVDTKSKWSDVVGSKLTRGHANPLK